jgi:hypothetical protein
MNSSEVDRARDIVAVILAIGLAVAVVMLMAGVLWDALHSDSPGISENATQLITMAFGGIIGILGSFLGYKAGTNTKGSADDEHPD